MYRNKFISQASLQKWKKKNISVFSKKNPEKSNSKYFSDYVLKKIKHKFPQSHEIKIYSTYSSKKQELLSKSLDQKINTKDALYKQLSGVIVNPKTGAIEAIQGGNSYEQTQFNRALYTKRSINSMLKPFLYAIAFDAGYNISDTLTWYNGSSRHKKYMTLYDSFLDFDLLNTIPLSSSLGHSYIYRYLQKIGIKDATDNIEILLGKSKASNMEIAQAFSSLYNGGYSIEPFVINKIKNKFGNIIYKRKKKEEQSF